MRTAKVNLAESVWKLSNAMALILPRRSVAESGD